MTGIQENDDHLVIKRPYFTIHSVDGTESNVPANAEFRSKVFERFQEYWNKRKQEKDVGKIRHLP